MPERRFFDNEKIDWVEDNIKHTGRIVDGVFDQKVNDWAYLVRDYGLNEFVKVYQSSILSRE